MNIFGPAHPLWGKLLELRRSGLFIKDLLKVAHDAGFKDLNYETLRKGLQRVSAGVGLPTRTSAWLMRKHKNTARLIDAAETMIFALMETLEDWQDAKEERARAGHSEAYRTTLAAREHRLRDTVFGYAERIRKVQLELERITSEEGGVTSGVPALVVTDAETMKEAIKGLMGRWGQVIEERLGSSDLDAAAVQRFGTHNIRPASEEQTERPAEDEADFREEDV